MSFDLTKITFQKWVVISSLIISNVSPGVLFLFTFYRSYFISFDFWKILLLSFSFASMMTFFYTLGFAILGLAVENYDHDPIEGDQYETEMSVNIFLYSMATCFTIIIGCFLKCINVPLNHTGLYLLPGIILFTTLAIVLKIGRSIEGKRKSKDSKSL